MSTQSITDTIIQATSRRHNIRAGFLATMPLWLGVVPFGALYAVSALAAGLDPLQTLAMSIIVFAGASQFTAVGLIAAGAGPLAVIITTAIINARHLLLTASMARFLRGAPPLARLLLAMQLTDESYAIGMRRFLRGDGSPAYLFGSNLSLFVCWQASTIAGILIGAAIPDPAAYGLDLVFPLTFIGLLLPLLRDRGAVVAALAGGLLAVLGALLLSGSWYILIAAIGAATIGSLVQHARRGPAE
ncbi:MAG TPA: AzlC family ABC transporter permease [Roseiflexaceae bacterium]|nr:AzlC family ABC transporter permease [Roseiflexaceae bacterium]